MAERRTIRTDYLARVEGEGAMSVRLRDGARRARRAPHLRAAAVLRGAPARPLVPRGARHHGPHLRHLPGRVPDERRPGDGGRLRRRGARADPRCCAGSSTAASGSRATPSTSTCSTRRTSSATTARSSSRATQPAAVERGLALKKAGNEVMALSAVARSIPSTSASAASTARRRARELRALVEPLERAREAALETVRWTAGFDFPEREVDCELVALVATGRLRDRARPDRLRPRPRHRGRPSTTSTSSRSTSSARTRSTRGARGGGTYLCGPLARFALSGDAALAARAARRPRRRHRAAVPRSVPQHRRARASSSSTPATRRCASSTAYEEPDAPAVDGRAGRRRRLRRDRGAARPALPPLPARRRRDDPRREDRAADVAEPARDRGRPARRRRRATRRSPTRSCATLCEQTIRNYDPCISCATHFLTLRGGAAVSERRVVIGIGNAYRGDDARRARGRRAMRGRACPATVRVVEAEQEPTRLLDAWEGADAAFVVDAVASGAEPARCTASTRPSGPLPAGVFRSSTHAFGVGEAVELARALGRLPRARGRLRGRGRGLRGRRRR